MGAVLLFGMMLGVPFGVGIHWYYCKAQGLFLEKQRLEAKIEALREQLEAKQS